ncbi:MAG: Fe-S-binding domain-containing protein [Chloroflexi bacterium HGW-Chloroflexi-8]|nr:MAG: Fe-S-binding domain-containing protein [Chloroflexi bacterium HGW-Chloroflexi-8]
MDKKVTITIDQIKITTSEDLTILKAAAEIGIQIPTICFHDACSSNALCRICVVEIKGARTLIPACVAKVSEGMEVETRSERVDLARKTILEMLASTSDLSQSPEILSMFEDYGVDINRFPDAEPRKPEIIDDNSMFIRDYEKCILCWRCVQVCADDAQYAYAINFKNRGYHTQISTFFEKPLPETSCVFCGQCVGVCPTNALKPKKQWLMELGNSPVEIMSMTRTERKKRFNK